jgi:hypothetical protein
MGWTIKESRFHSCQWPWYLCLLHSFLIGSEIHSPLFPGVKGPKREADYSPPYNGEVKRAWRSSSTPSYVFMAHCLTEDRGKFTPPLMIHKRIKGKTVAVLCTVNVGSRWRRTVSFMFRKLWSLEESPMYPLNKTLRGLQIRFWGRRITFWSVRNQTLIPWSFSQ